MVGGGRYQVDHRSGSMHGKRALVREIFYGADNRNLFLRVDFAEAIASLGNLKIQIHLKNTKEPRACIGIEGGAAVIYSGDASAACRDILEIALPRNGDHAEVSLSFWQDGLPVDAIPREGALQLSDSGDWDS